MWGSDVFVFFSPFGVVCIFFSCLYIYIYISLFIFLLVISKFVFFVFPLLFFWCFVCHRGCVIFHDGCHLNIWIKMPPHKRLKWSLVPPTMKVIGEVMDEVISNALEKLMHVVTNEPSPNTVEDQVDASARMEEPIHVATNESTCSIIEDQISVSAQVKEPMHVATNELNPFTIKKEVQHIVVFLPPPND